MEQKIENLKNSQVKVVVSLNAEELIGYVKDAEQRLVSEIQMDGFRPGKVPPEVLRQKLGEDRIRQEALSFAIEGSLAQLIKKENLDFMNYENLKVLENSKELLKYEVTLTLFPSVQLGPYTGLVLKKIEAQVEDVEIEKVINDLLRSRTTFHEVQRPIQKDDRVEVDFTIKENGVVIDGGESKNHPITVGENKFVQGFEDNIIGMSVGEHKEFQLNIPKDYYQKTIAGKTLDAAVSVVKIEERAVPNLSDEFAQGLGTFTTVDDLRASIKNGILTEKQEKEKEKARINLVDQIVAKSKIDVPDFMIDQRLDSMLTSFDEELHRNGLDLPLYLAHLKKTQDDLRKEWRKQAESQVRSNLVLRAIARSEQITVPEEEIESELQQTLQYSMMRMGQSPEKLTPEDIENMRRRVQDIMLNEKVFSYLESQATTS